MKIHFLEGGILFETFYFHGITSTFILVTVFLTCVGINSAFIFSLTLVANLIWWAIYQCRTRLFLSRKVKFNNYYISHILLTYNIKYFEIVDDMILKLRIIFLGEYNLNNVFCVLFDTSSIPSILLELCHSAILVGIYSYFWAAWSK